MLRRLMSIEQVDTVIARVMRDERIIAASKGTEYQLFPISIPRSEGEALSGWVTREGAARTIEVGLAHGISALFICEGLIRTGRPNARHVAIDPNQERGFSGVALQLLREAGVDHLLEFHGERSEIVLPRLLSEGRVFDLGFIDGNHRFDWVFIDAVYLGRMVRGGGVIFLDDYQLPSVRKTVAFLTNNLGWRVEDEGVAEAGDVLHRWIVLRLPPMPQDRTFDYFVDF